jgi:hypothetical protein|uniref:DinB family protein n=1 Tax=Daejeonella sp. TaxID=2805397 RepID=UPI00404A237B
MEIEKLIQNVALERNLYLEQLKGISELQAQWKSIPEEWNLIEITEHLFWSEQGGIFGMWKSILAIRAGQMERTLDSKHKDMPIKQIIDLTWQVKETVPEMAAPRMGGALSFWIASLNSLQEVLQAFGEILQEDELRYQSQPHPISGALDFKQRLEFLAFHISRHREQCKKLLNELPL